MDVVSAVILAHSEDLDLSVKLVNCPGCDSDHYCVEDSRKNLGIIGSAIDILAFARRLRLAVLAAENHHQESA